MLIALKRAILYKKRSYSVQKSIFFYLEYYKYKVTTSFDCSHH